MNAMKVKYGCTRRRRVACRPGRRAPVSESEGRCGTSSGHPLAQAENSLVPTSTKQYNASPATRPAVAWFRGRLSCEPAT